MNPWTEDFPILNQKMRGKRLAYLDNAATVQRPLAVLNAVDEFYRTENANPHRGLYELSIQATKRYEDARHTVKEFIGAEKDCEVIFTRNASESLNLVAYSYGMAFVNKGDEIALPVSEHHSNIVPWQMVAQAKGAKLVYLYPDVKGRLTDEEIESKITSKTKVVVVAHVSNVLGSVYPVRKIADRAHAVGAVIVVDCAQSIPHYPVNVKELGADFIAFSGHKMMAPMGIGVLYGREELLNKMPPFLRGGEMIEYVHEQSATFAPLPQKFEAGTQNVGGAVGLEAAIHYLQKVGYDRIHRTEQELLNYTLDEMAKIPNLTVYGGTENRENRCGVISFNVDGVHPHDVAGVLDADGVAIRVGHHCAQPLMEYLGVNATCRVSFYFYNTKEDAVQFIASLKKACGGAAKTSNTDGVMDSAYRKIIMEYSNSDYNKHAIENPTITLNGVNPSCGDEITLQLREKDGVIEDAGYTGIGCQTSQVSTSIMCDVVRGKTAQEAVRLAKLFIGMIRGDVTDEKQLEDLEEAIALRDVAHMPARVKCAVLGWRTLEDAVEGKTDKAG